MMFQAAGSSPRRGPDNPSNGNAEMDSSRNRNQDNYRENVRSLTPREQYQRHKQAQRPRNPFKNMPDMTPHYFPPHISDHGRWEGGENCIIPGFNGPPRFGGPRRGSDKDLLGFHSLPVLKQPMKNVCEGGDGIVDKIPEEKYRMQLRNFPELPTVAHEKIRDFGNEIVACYSVQLCKFFNDSLIETTPNSYAVFTKKNRTAQRWLMVFKHERGRVNVSYNKLLTNQLLVRCLNSVSVEVEPARSLSNLQQENCVFTFSNHTEANKFVHDIHESQTILWNHREMLTEQSMRGQQSEYFMENPNFGYYSPRPLSARSPASYMMVPSDIPPSLTPRMKVLPPVPQQNRQKRSPFTVSARTPRADLDENWRGTPESLTVGSAEVGTQVPTPNSVTQSPMRKRSKGTNKDNHLGASTVGGGDGDFVYNSLTHAMALQQNVPPSFKQNCTLEASTMNEVSNGRRFQASEVLVSNKRDVGTGAPDEEFFSLGSGEIQLIDNGEDQFDEIKSYTSSGQLMFSQILFGWNKVRTAEGCHSHNPRVRWWIGAAVIGTGSKNGEAPRIREFKATFADEESANKFAELFQEGAIKGNNPEVRKKYLAQSLRV